MKKAIISLAAFSLICTISYSQITEITVDTINENTTWSGTVRITKDLTIALGKKVTIQPGTVVEFGGYYMINLRGAINALGSPEDTILFTRPDTNGFHDLGSEAGGWNGIRIDDYDFQMWQSDTSLFRFCKFENSKSIKEDETEGGVFTIRFTGKVIFDNCLFKNNASRTGGGAVYMLADIEPLFLNCSFLNNSAFRGGAIHMTGKARPHFYGCLFHENRGGEGGAIFSSFSRGSILNCIFCNNYADEIGGAILLDNSRDKIVGNLIANNQTPGAGGGVKLNDSWPEFNNNTVCCNNAGCGGGLEFWGLCNANFYNNILWGNTISPAYEPQQMAINSSTSTPNFYNCIIEGGTDSIENYTGISVDLVTLDPHFINPSAQSGTASNGLEADFSVEPISPAINNGSNDIRENLMIEVDLMGNPRILHGIIDIGSYEKQMGSLVVSDTVFENTIWIADTVKVNSDIVIVDSATLNIAPGTVVDFQDHYRLEVIGTIRAIGSIKFPITFTVSDTNGFSNKSTDDGSWGGIIFDNSQFGANAIMNDNDSSIFRYCTFQYAKNILQGWDSPPGGAIIVRYFSKLEIANCTIQNNFAFFGGGIGITMYSHPYIHNNLIYKNRSLADGGGIVISNSSSPKIISNYIFNNTAKRNLEGSFGGGIRINYADPVLINNVICNNYASNGGGLYMDDSRPRFSNNTVCNNVATQEGGGIVLYKCKLDVFNSVFRGNSSPFTVDRVNQVVDHDNNNFFHNNIEGGLECVIPWWFYENYTGEYAGNIDADPEFTNPTQGAGPGFDALVADWSITDYSNNINKGHPESQQILDLPDKDIAGKRRFNHDIIDIGAFENQGEPVFIIREPNNQFACVGDTIEFSVEVEGKARFQWLKDGELIEGADTNLLMLNSVILDDKADYICLIKNGYGLLISNNVTLEVNAPPEILLQTESQWVKEDANLKLEIHGRGTEPVHYAWQKNGNWLPEENSPEFRITGMSYEDEGTYYCAAGNVCGETISEPITLFVAPQICMVTVDLETGDNLIVWEKKGAAPVSAYNIYRESIVAGEYEPIGHVPFDMLSIFLDTVADPELQAYIYKITAIDHDGNESDISLCKPHKTIHLLTTINLATGATQLDWDHYYGFTYGTFHIYRSLTESNFSLLTSKSSSTTEYTDPNPGNDIFFYRVSVQRPEDCVASGEGKKADSGPYSHAMSNVEDNRLQATDMEGMAEEEGLTIYPNPFSDLATLNFPNPENIPYVMRITDLSGKIVRSAKIRSSEFILQRDNLEIGYYIIELKGDKIYRSMFVIE